MVKLTKGAYEQYLNDIVVEQGDDQWIIGGKIRMAHMWQNRFGSAIRLYDPMRFQVGYKEGVMNHKN